MDDNDLKHKADLSEGLTAEQETARQAIVTANAEAAATAVVAGVPVPIIIETTIRCAEMLKVLGKLMATEEAP